MCWDSLTPLIMVGGVGHKYIAYANQSRPFFPHPNVSGKKQSGYARQTGAIFHARYLVT